MAFSGFFWRACPLKILFGEVSDFHMVPRGEHVFTRMATSATNAGNISSHDADVFVPSHEDVVAVCGVPKTPFLLFLNRLFRR